MSAKLAAEHLFSISGKTSVVTGGGRGIGYLIAKTFVQNNAKVYITSRNEKACKTAADELTKLGPGECIPMAHDLSSFEGCSTFTEELQSREDKLHILVNNSGTSWGEPLDTYPDHAWGKVFDLNVKTVFNLSRACLPLLDSAATEEDPSRIINIGSIAGIQPQPVPTYAYDASKAAVHMLTKKLSSEFADRRSEGGYRITVNAIAPGFVPSKMSQQLLTYTSKEAIESAVPLGRLGQAEDIGGAALYLSSKAGAWVTGAILPVDGGTTSQPFQMVPNL
eukprot:gb/GECG01016018.1/.p1 GENE.gb/GECG01016018.1/~~gb/GECG01016018.1/.p1  ORF type:complete len:279 (+),score=32.25 gb/GECG01016018.1/:1-837(+)